MNDFNGPYGLKLLLLPGKPISQRFAVLVGKRNAGDLLRLLDHFDGDVLGLICHCRQGTLEHGRADP